MEADKYMYWSNYNPFWLFSTQRHINSITFSNTLNIEWAQVTKHTKTMVSFDNLNSLSTKCKEFLHFKWSGKL